MTNARNIVITKSDMDKLDRLVESARSADREHLEVLRAELDRAEVVEGDKAPRNVVVMNAWINLTDLDTGLTHEYQLVFPRDADFSRNKVSVLAPIGTALLGYQTGSEIEWRVPGGVRRFRIDSVKRPIRPRMTLKTA